MHNKIIKSARKMNRQDLISYYIFACLSKKRSDNQDLQWGLLDIINTGHEGDGTVSFTQIEAEVDSHSFIEDRVDYLEKEYVTIDSVQYRIFTATNVAGFVGIMRHLQDYNLGFVYRIMDRFLENTNINDFESIKKNLRTLVYIGDFKQKDLIVDFYGTEIMLPTPYSVIGAVEECKIKIDAGTFNKLSEKNRRRFIFHETIINNKMNVVSNKEVMIFKRYFSIEELNKILDFMAGNFGMMSQYEYSLIGLYVRTLMYGTLGYKLNLSVGDTHPWEWENTFWKQVEEISKLVKPTNDNLMYFYQLPLSGVTIDGDSYILTKANHAIKLEGSFGPRKEHRDRDLKDVYSALIQELSYILDYSLPKVSYFTWKLKDYRLNWKGNSFVFDCIDLNKSKQLVYKLSGSKEMKYSFKPNNVSSSVSLFPLGSLDQTETIKYIDKAKSFVDESRKSHKKLSSEYTGTSTADVLTKINEDLKEVTKKIENYNKELVIKEIESRSNYCLIMHNVSIQRKESLHKSEMRDEEKKTGMVYWDEMRVASKAAMIALNYIQTVVATSKTDGNKTLDDKLIFKLVWLLTMKNIGSLSYQSFAVKGLSLDIGGNDILWTPVIKENEIIGGPSRYNIKKYGEREFDSWSNLALEVIMKLDYDQLAKKLGEKKISNTVSNAEKLAYNWLPSPITSNNHFNFICQYLYDFFDTEVNNFMKISVPYNKKLEDEYRKLISYSFEKYVHSLVLKVAEFKPNKELEHDSKTREFDSIYIDKDKVISIECKAFGNSRNTKDIINRFDREKEKIAQAKEQKMFLKKLYPDKEIHVLICLNKKSPNPLVTDDSEIVKLVEEILQRP